MKLYPDLVARMSLILGPQTSLGRGALQLPSLAGLHVMPSAPQVLQNAGALHLLFEHTQRRLDAVAFAEVNFDHLGYRPIFVTFSAAGPF